MPRRSSNPLDYAPGWQRGTAPQPEPSKTQPEPFEQAIDPHSVDWRCQMRATAIIRRLYGIDAMSWHKNAKLYDKQARKVYEMLMRGEAIPDRYRCHHREPEPIDATQWGPSGYW